MQIYVSMKPSNCNVSQIVKVQSYTNLFLVYHVIIVYFQYQLLRSYLYFNLS